VSQSRGALQAAPFPCTPNPRPSPFASLRTRSRHFQLTKPNTSCTIITPASLRSDCCSPSLRNAVRLPSGISVHLHRNTHDPSNTGALSRIWSMSSLRKLLETGMRPATCRSVSLASTSHRTRFSGKHFAQNTAFLSGEEGNVEGSLPKCHLTFERCGTRVPRNLC
jgi:hypothetical protein